MSSLITNPFVLIFIFVDGIHIFVIHRFLAYLVHMDVAGSNLSVSSKAEENQHPAVDIHVRLILWLLFSLFYKINHVLG